MTRVATIPEFRRTDQDRRQPRQVVTAILLGDPPADLEHRRQEAADRVSAPLRMTAHHSIGRTTA